MNFVDDVQLVLSPHRLDVDIRTKLPNVVDAAVRRAVDFQNVHIVARRDSFADFALVTRVPVDRIWTVQRLGQNPRRRRLANSASPRKEIRVSHSVGQNRIPQCLSNMLLPHNIRKPLRPESSSKNRVRTS